MTRPGTILDPALTDRIMREAEAAAPSGYMPKAGASMLPRRPTNDRCRLCGENARLTKEHIPPGAAGNKGTHRSHTFTAWLSSDDRRRLHGGQHQQGGIWGYTLCKACNEKTGQWYGTEYLGWVVRAEKILRELPGPIELDRNPRPWGVGAQFGGLTDGGVAPGLLVRQVLSIMCSLSADWDLAGRHPEVRRIVLDRATEPLPSSLHLSMALFLGPHSRISGPQLRADTESGHWAWIMEMAHRPFAFTMVLASDHEAATGLDLGPLTEVELDRRVAFSGEYEVGFGWSPYPGDYRSSAALGWGGNNGAGGDADA